MFGLRLCWCLCGRAFVLAFVLAFVWAFVLAFVRAFVRAFVLAFVWAFVPAHLSCCRTHNDIIMSSCHFFVK